MLNVYTTPLKYKNFAGKERVTTLHFHITPRELTDWFIDNPAMAEKFMRDITALSTQLEENEDGDTTDAQKRTMLGLVRVLAELGNGYISDDNEVFDKSDRDRFVHSAAYDAFRLFLFTRPNELTHFIETLLPEATMAEFAASLDIADEELGADQITVVKDASGLSREELIKELARHDSN